MILKEIINGLEIDSFKGDLDIEINSIAYDSRKVKNGSLFVCIEGFKTDGHKYINTAIENGAKAIIVQKDVDVPENITIIKYKNTRYALAFVSNAFFSEPSKRFKLLGITGTKGKTTTTFMIKAVLRAYGKKTGLIGTIINCIGDTILPAERTTPESYDLQALFSEMAQNAADAVIMEVSSQGLELHRVSCSDFDIGVFTNLSKDHIGPNEHASMEEYLHAKSKLFKMCKKGLVNVDSGYSEYIIKNSSCEIFTYGIEKEADIMAKDIVKHAGCVEFRVVSPWINDYLKVNIPGKFSVYNALATIGTCCLYGIPLEAIKEGLLKVSVPGRAEVVNTGKDFTVIIDYAHSPDSLENILTTVKGFCKGRLICMFGCGGDRDKTKRPIMGEISGRISDYTIITTDNPRTEDPSAIISEIEEGIKKTDAAYITITDRKEAIKYALMHASADDVVVLAGKGHETYQIFKDKTIHFDEREVIRDILNNGL
jgi:UDP-N-acetylmuramoyl-L-alanyl-D-glutamate--2,6-diaminopimelate ligase